ncbi:crt [Symbiodinium pilosum]|uniref:Crt protein n=1 Tax=Symbiodinium pilosum TaxID=2952 RepID=A0A812U4Y0_SYMPI|nr:crt [Symbiodinium pilosum]
MAEPDEPHCDWRESLAALRGLVGPHASEKQLENQLKRFSNDPRKAANGYFRSACSLGLPFDFDPRPLSIPRRAPSVYQSNDGRQPQHGAGWQELEPPFFPAAFFLQVTDCRALLAVSHELHVRVARDEAFWTRALRTVFGEVRPLT